SAKVSCWLIRLLILGSGYNTMISHLGLIRTFLRTEITRRPAAILLPPGGIFIVSSQTYLCVVVQKRRML
ncbi:hypothetical protein, partial [Citrobacter braakii]|uniref:hypothetical protein n=1 Tax=Citrobacter braakii TaxID=57706 RepID=UPI001F2BF71F